jgi:Glycosyl hydrolase family 1
MAGQLRDGPVDGGLDVREEAGQLRVTHEVRDRMMLPRQDALTQHDLDPRILGEQLVRHAEHSAGFAKQLDSMSERSRNIHGAAGPPERCVLARGRVVVEHDEIADVLDLGAHLLVELVDIRLCDAGPGKHLHEADDAALDLLLRLKRDYELPPIYITENGAAYQDRIAGNRIEDEQRRQYIESHLVAVADAIQRGADVRGYFVWSLMDNFEWAEGYRKRFGIVYVDYATLDRALKGSGLWYRSLLNGGSMSR